MKRLLCWLIFFLPLVATAQLVSFGQKDSVYSDILKEKRPLWIYTPPDDTAYFQRPAYPVIYVLDGDTHFATMQTMIQFLTSDDNTVFPQMIIVGIQNTPGNRTKNMAEAPEDLTSFIEKELFPYIEKKYATAPYRILIGHSLGGLYTTNTLLHHKNLFNAYIASDPSIFFNNAALLHQLPLQQDLRKKTYYLAIAGEMKNSIGHIHTTAIRTLADSLKAHDNGLRWNAKYYPDDDHKSVPFIAIYDGLRFIFPHHHFPAYLYMDNACPADSLKSLVIAHYKTLSAEMGYNVRPPEWYLNQMGYRNLNDKRYDKSELAFQLNIDYYPTSFNVYDSMGDYYKAVNNMPKAIELWKKALSLRNSTEIRQKLTAETH